MLINFLIFTIGVPVVYALLPNRQATTYINVFKVLFAEAKKMNKKFNPSIIMTDFEPGLSKAISIEASFSSKSLKHYN